MSWIKTLFHPVKTSREINELRSLLTQHEEYSDAVEIDLNNLKTELSILKNKLNQSVEDNNKLNQTISLLSSQLADTRSELSKTRLELQSAEEDLKIIEELELLFSQCQEKINRYELRIEKLNAALTQAKNIIKSSATAHAYDEITPINSGFNTTLNQTDTQTFHQHDNYSNVANTTINIENKNTTNNNSGNNKDRNDFAYNKTENNNTTNKTSNYPSDNNGRTDKTFYVFSDDEDRTNKTSYGLPNNKTGNSKTSNSLANNKAKSNEENTTEKISFGETPSIDDWLRPLPDDII